MPSAILKVRGPLMFRDTDSDILAQVIRASLPDVVLAKKVDVDTITLRVWDTGTTPWTQVGADTELVPANVMFDSGQKGTAWTVRDALGLGYNFAYHLSHDFIPDGEKTYTAQLDFVFQSGDHCHLQVDLLTKKLPEDG